MLHHHPGWTLGLVLGFMCPILQAQQSFTIFPKAIHLTGPNSSSAVLIQSLIEHPETGVSTVSGQVDTGVRMTSTNPSVARVDGGRVVAVEDGVAELLVSVSGSDRQARVPIIVRSTGQPPPRQFTAHIQPVLSKLGCNSGGCHGALSGKGGFKLSLLAYDSTLDHHTITTEDQGRRIEPADPESSLLLTKPTTKVPHKGGLRLDPDSIDYEILAQWIAAGCSGPKENEPKLLGIEVLPQNLQLDVSDRQPLIVRAFYEDGRVEDVSHWARFSSCDESVLEISDDGEINVVGNGRGAIVAWFSSQIALSSVDVPYRSPKGTPADSPMENRLRPAVTARDAEQSLPSPLSDLESFHAHNFIDEILFSEWQALGLAPSPGCDDATFLRRAFLTATGSLPDAEQVEEFLNDPRPDRRSQLIARLLSSPKWIDYWTYQWSDLLLVNGDLLRPKAVEAFYRWIQSKVQQNVPWDQFVSEIILARGDSLTQGATNFYAIHQTPEALTENTCLAFMGLSLDCAKCHNHPLEKWTNDQYYAMANLFSRVRAKGWGGDSRNGDGMRTLVVLQRGDLIQPSRGIPQPPAALDQPALDPNDPGDRREALASWLTSPENPYFTRAIVNRVWANFMGVGLAEPVDDMRISNPPSSPRLMAALSGFLIENRYDLKTLMSLIMNSKVFQLSSRATEFNQSDSRFYCRYYPRRLDAEVLHDAVVQVTGVPTLFNQIQFSGADRQPTDIYPEGTRAIQLYDSAVANYFLQTFGRHQRRITCECERSSEPTVVQILHLSNGSTLNDKLSTEDNRISQWLAQPLTVRQIIDKAYLYSLCRRPNDEEIQLLEAQLTLGIEDDASRREFIEDLLWGLMTSSEFLFLH
jgi:hypothetical protein